MWDLFTYLIVSFATVVGLMHVPPQALPPTIIDAAPIARVATNTAKSVPSNFPVNTTPKPVLQLKATPTPAPERIENTKTEYLPLAPDVSTQLSPVQTFTNEKGEIVDETGKVLWSPPKPAIAPTPTTTPVADDIACGYEVQAGLPLGSKCPPAFSPDGKPLFPCYPNQEWTCRPTAPTTQLHY